MGKKVLLNIFYNIALFTLFLTVIWGYQQQQYFIMLGALFIIGIFIMLKIRLIKEVKQLTRKS